MSDGMTAAAIAAHAAVWIILMAVSVSRDNASPRSVAILAGVGLATTTVTLLLVTA